jgi:membrane-associated phospholipid phosphatase
MDRTVLLWVVAHRTGWGTAAARGLMAVGTRPVPLAAAALAALIVVTVFRSWRLGAATGLAAVVALVLSEVAKSLGHRPRPPAALALVRVAGFSMPSTDAALTAAAATVLMVAALRTGRRTGRLVAGALAAAVVGVGVALVYLGAHWTTDVVAGWVLGIGVGAAVARVLLGRRPQRSRPAPAA